MGSTTLCDSIVVSSGEKRHAATAAEVCAAYRDRRKRQRLDVDDEPASSSSPASPVGDFLSVPVLLACSYSWELRCLSSWVVG